MSEGKKGAGGRPKITTADFPSFWKEKLVSMGAEGCSDVEMRGFLNYICHETWERLLAEDAEFSETVKKARTACQIFWEKNGRLSLNDKDFSATLWYMNMKNRFGWSDKKEVKQTGTPPSVTLNVVPNKENADDSKDNTGTS